MTRFCKPTAFIRCLGALFIFVAVGTSTAAAGESPGLDVTVVGGEPLFDITGLYPGFESSATIRVRNSSAEDATVGLAVEDVVSDDNGCNEPEAVVDLTCGDGEGELGQQLLLSIERRTAGSTPELLLPATPLLELADGTELEQSLAPGAEASYDVTVQLPAASGNETQTDSAEFNVTVLGMSDEAAASVLGSRDLREGEVLQATASTGVLPSTGASVSAQWRVGAAAVGVGAALTLVAKVRRRTAVHD